MVILSTEDNYLSTSFFNCSIYSHMKTTSSFPGHTFVLCCYFLWKTWEKEVWKTETFQALMDNPYLTFSSKLISFAKQIHQIVLGIKNNKASTVSAIGFQQISKSGTAQKKSCITCDSLPLLHLRNRSFSCSNGNFSHGMACLACTSSGYHYR